jgi:hypothetical protein
MTQWLRCEYARRVTKGLSTWENGKGERHTKTYSNIQVGAVGAEEQQTSGSGRYTGTVKQSATYVQQQHSQLKG